VIVYDEEEQGSGQAAQWRLLRQRGMLQQACEMEKCRYVFFINEGMKVDGKGPVGPNP
jgi:hypothetical protein